MRLPFFFLSLAFACAGSRLGYVTPWAAAAALLGLAGWAGAAGDVSAPSRFFTAVCCYALLVAFNSLLVSPTYTPAGLYHPLLFALAYVAFRRFDGLAERRSAYAALALGAILAAWGLVQIGALGVARAHALFEAPATYAAVLNLLLVPLLALVMTGGRSTSLLAVTGLLAAAMFSADSRGGLLALAAGLGAAAILALRASVSAPPTAEAQAASSQSRLELYALSWSAWRERPLAGTGYLTFRYVLEQGRAKVPSYGESSETWFVHNDYLQTLQELGPLGLAALLALVGFPAWLSYRRIPVVPVERRAVALAAASALAAMGFHALVEFPFYIPVCLLLYGALLGALDRRLGEALAAPWRPALWHPAVRTGILLVAGIVLLRPVAAEAAAEWGLRRSMAGAGRDAAFWLGTARRIEPADWRYHWYAGQFWDAQAADAGRREAARLAADAFAAGFDANPLEVRNLLGKIAVHRRHSALLDAPADRGTLQAWLAQAEALAPLHREVRRERELLGAAQ